MDETRLEELRRLIERPLPLPYHPLHRFYSGGSLTRAFRGLDPGTDDEWSEDWVGSCTLAGNPDPSGAPQGLSPVAIGGGRTVTLRELVELFPEEVVGATFAQRWGANPGVLVKLLSPAGPVPLHAHPSREWARRHLASPYGKTEAWIILQAPGNGSEPAYAGIGFREGADRKEFYELVGRRAAREIRSTLHRTEVQQGEVYVAHAGVPHFLGPRISFIEVQEPSDHLVIPEWTDADDAGATMGLGFNRALDMIDFNGVSREATLERARQQPVEIRRSGGSTETRLINSDVLEFFDATRLDVQDEIAVQDGRFYVGVVTQGRGEIVGNFGRMPVRQGDTFACAAMLEHAFVAGAEPIRVVRCMGPND